MSAIAISCGCADTPCTGCHSSLVWYTVSRPGISPALALCLARWVSSTASCAIVAEIAKEAPLGARALHLLRALPAEAAGL
jgi:hypothetical protein